MKKQEGDFRHRQSKILLVHGSFLSGCMGDFSGEHWVKKGIGF